MIKAVLNREPRLSESKIRSAVFGLQAEVLAGIYQEEINIAIWKRELIPNISHSANFVLTKNPNLKLAVTASPKNISKILEEAIGIEDDAIALIIDVKDIVDIFCCLFDVNQVGLRLVSLNHAMCPRFHVDNVPCRLLTTYCGNGTEWLNHDCVNRKSSVHAQMVCLMIGRACLRTTLIFKNFAWEKLRYSKVKVGRVMNQRG